MMKPTVKITSLLMAVLLLFSVFAAGCSLEKEWSYKTSEQELAIGVYLVAMQEAYTEAQSYASSLDGYDANSESWLDMEITDSDGNKAVAKDWIKDTAERKCLELLVLRPELERLGATVDEASLKTLATNYETQWVTQDKAKLEKLGVSMESYTYFKSTYATLRDQLFDLLYGAGGTQEATTDEIHQYLVDNYARYQAVPVSLYESTTDEAGSSKNVALSDEKIKEITDALDGIAAKVNAEKDAAKAAELSTKLLGEYLPTVDMTAEQVQNVTLPKENAGITDKDLEKALQGLEEGKAVTVKIGDEDNEKSYFYLFRYDAASLKENYQADGVTDKQILTKMKSKDYITYLKALIDKSNYQKSGAVDKYQPNIFFEKSEQSSAVAG
ncbi:MAG: hypothetical protein II127_07495 [Ruminococcus sp.]|nr:hypothetical protein [Ruminococcus sp.]